MSFFRLTLSVSNKIHHKYNVCVWEFTELHSAPFLLLKFSSYRMLICGQSHLNSGHTYWSCIYYFWSRLLFALPPSVLLQPSLTRSTYTVSGWLDEHSLRPLPPPPTQWKCAVDEISSIHQCKPPEWNWNSDEVKSLATTIARHFSLGQRKSHQAKWQLKRISTSI